MQEIVKRFIEVVIRHFPVYDPIYEIGAFQVDTQVGYSDLRPYFPGKTYIGCDMRAGPGVDLVQDVEAMTLPDKCAKSVLICDTLEHVQNPFKAIDEIYRILTDDGLLILSVPFNFVIHDHPFDYWRFTPMCVEMLLKKFVFTTILWELKPAIHDPIEVYAVAMKNKNPDIQIVNNFMAETYLKYGSSLKYAQTHIAASKA